MPVCFSSFPLLNVENKWSVVFYGLRQICFSHWLHFLQRIKQWCSWPESKLSQWGGRTEAEQTFMLKLHYLLTIKLSELIWSVCWFTTWENEQLNRIAVLTRPPHGQSRSSHGINTTPQMGRNVSKRYGFLKDEAFPQGDDWSHVPVSMNKLNKQFRACSQARLSAWRDIAMMDGKQWKPHPVAKQKWGHGIIILRFLYFNK